MFVGFRRFWCENMDFGAKTWVLVRKKSFPQNVIETHVSLFDNTNEGIRHRELPIFSVQYHPESAGSVNGLLFLNFKFMQDFRKIGIWFGRYACD